jgi:hypothetical protein
LSYAYDGDGTGPLIEKTLYYAGSHPDSCNSRTYGIPAGRKTIEEEYICAPGLPSEQI